MKVAGGLGVFGKLPAHGDFVSRGLDNAFINRWDGWLQAALESSREQLGSRWLEVYLCAPVWRFVLSSGVVDEHNWMGIVLPSVDRVGRYFPLTLAASFDGQLPATMATLADDWYQAVESTSLSALDRSLGIEELCEQLKSISLPPELTAQSWRQPEERKHWAIPLPEREAASSGLGILAGWLLAQKLPSYSLWWSSGSEFVQPSLRISPGLPAISAFAALLDDLLLDERWCCLIPNAVA